MLLSSVIIVLREVLEAALLFSVLIALSKKMGLNSRWLIWTFLLGIMGSIAYGMNLNMVSDWFDGVGQEVINALIQLIIYLLLVFYMLILTRYYYFQIIPKLLLSLIMIISLSFAMMREGAEIILYFLSVTHNDAYYLTVLTGMTIGASIGISVGLLFYYLLTSFKHERAIIIGLVLLLFVSAGMVSQASLLLIQADWLPSQLPLWNTSSFLSEKSVMGQLLYALLGYESTPTAIQVSLYLFAIIFPVLLILGFKFARARHLNVSLGDHLKEHIKSDHKDL